MDTYYKKTFGTRLFDVLNVLLLLMLTALVVFPFWNQLCISFSDLSITPVSNISISPIGFNMEAYQMILQDTRISKAAIISLIRVVIGTIGTLFCTGLLAYITTIRWFSGRKFIRRAFLITMYFFCGLDSHLFGLYSNRAVQLILGLYYSFVIQCLLHADYVFLYLWSAGGIIRSSPY